MVIKKQATAETATYGSEFVASRTCTEQITDLRYTLHYLGVSIRGPSYMFGDNKSVVESSSMPYSKLHRRHNMLSYHKTRQAIAFRIVKYFHIDGDINPADFVSKNWAYNMVKESLKSIMF